MGVLLLQGSKNRNFTHPIFESDFDCLTGKHRILALSLLPLLPLIIQNKKNENAIQALQLLVDCIYTVNRATVTHYRALQSTHSGPIESNMLNF